MAANPLRILFVSSEVAPFAKTGGLADVSAALPRQLHRAGHHVALLLPLYRQVTASGVEPQAVEGLSNLTVRIGSWTVAYSIRVAKLPGGALDTFFVDCPALYDRQGIYTNDADEHLRFLLLTRAALDMCQMRQWAPDVAHWNDWQTSLGPLYLKSTYAWDRLFSTTRSVLTIHNLGYQGTFDAHVVEDLSLGDAKRMLHQDDLNAGKINFLKTGLMYSDALTTVSPTYAREIQTEAGGFGLDAVLRRRSGALHGILNGVDDSEWSPQKDKFLPAKFSSGSLKRKEKNKESLMNALGLPYRKDVPTVAIITRLTPQKGIDLIEAVLPSLLRERDFAFVALGTGEQRHEEFLARLEREFPGRVCFYRGYSNELAHRIEGGADIFLMPSLYEPCGLNQMYSLLYGTIPVVRNTGGLADTVIPFDPQSGRGNGIVFGQYAPASFARALRLALHLYREPELWKQMQRNGMNSDFSWSTQAEKYVALYRSIAVRTEVRA